MMMKIYPVCILPCFYIGQADGIKNRLENHFFILDIHTMIVYFIKYMDCFIVDLYEDVLASLSDRYCTPSLVINLFEAIFIDLKKPQS